MTNRRLAGWTLVVLGTILLSTGIAWGCALWAPMTASRSLTRDEISVILDRGVGTERFLAITSGVENFGIGWAFVIAGTAALPPPAFARHNARLVPGVGARAIVNPVPVGPQDKYIHVVRAGWPMSCLQGFTTGVGGSYSRHGVIEPPHVLSQMGVKPQRLVPLYPRWGGLAVNTVFYGAVFWLAIPGPKLLRRVMRRRHGCCPTCGYDLAHHDHDTCPECGAP